MLFCVEFQIQAMASQINFSFISTFSLLQTKNRVYINTSLGIQVAFKIFFFKYFNFCQFSLFIFGFCCFFLLLKIVLTSNQARNNLHLSHLTYYNSDDYGVFISLPAPETPLLNTVYTKVQLLLPKIWKKAYPQLQNHSQPACFSVTFVAFNQDQPLQLHSELIVYANFYSDYVTHGLTLYIQISQLGKVQGIL